MGNAIRKKTMNVLIDMGVGANTNGFNFITDIMCLFEEDDLWRRAPMMFLYEKIAAMNKTTASSVERSIRHAFEVALTKGNLSTVKQYLTFQNTKNSNLLSVMYIRLSQEDEHEKDKA